MVHGSVAESGRPSVLLAGILAAQGIRFVLVGSSALRLQGEAIPAGDVDVVPWPDAANIAQLHDVLLTMALRWRTVPSLRQLFILDTVSVRTSYGKLDCLLDRGRQDWTWLRKGAQVVRFCDVDVLTASVADALALRDAFKTSVEGDSRE